LGAIEADRFLGRHQRFFVPSQIALHVSKVGKGASQVWNEGIGAGSDQNAIEPDCFFGRF